MIDFHTHILPNMDDGSTGVEESIQMLQLSKDQGVDLLLATPHFYPEREDVWTFLTRRAEAAQMLATVWTQETGAEKAVLPQIVLGAEVKFFLSISGLEQVEKLTIEGTTAMLLELPFDGFGKLEVNEIYKLSNKHGMTPIIAHVDRYLDSKDNEHAIRELLHMGAILQMNCESIIKLKTRRKCLKMIADGQIGLLGTDCHNMASRKPNMAKALEVVEKKLGQSAIKEMNKRAQLVLGREAALEG